MSLFAHFDKVVPPELEIMVGMPIKEATAVATALLYVVRLAEVDGEPYSLEATFQEGRINFFVKDGVVISLGVG